jgi:hypothetical protein
MVRALLVRDATSSGFIDSFRWLHFVSSIAAGPHAVGCQVEYTDVMGLRLRRQRTEMVTHTHTHTRYVFCLQVDVRFPFGLCVKLLPTEGLIFCLYSNSPTVGDSVGGFCFCFVLPNCWLKFDVCKERSATGIFSWVLSVFKQMLILFPVSELQLYASHADSVISTHRIEIPCKTFFQIIHFTINQKIKILRFMSQTTSLIILESSVSYFCYQKDKRAKPRNILRILYSFS